MLKARIGRLAIGAAAVAVIALLVFIWQRDPRLPADVAAAQLQALVKSSSPFRCERQENDVSIQLDDVDYFCENAVTGYWIGTDGSKITETQPAG